MMSLRMRCWVLAALWLVVTSVGGSLLGADRSAAWKEVDEAIKKGLPKTAIERLGPIQEGATADGAWAEAAKALLRRIVLEGTIEGNKPEERVRRLSAEVSKSPAVLQPVYEVVLGHWYWAYLQQNRWRLMQRTAVAGGGEGDLATWDLPRLLAETDKHFQAGLEAAPLLQKIAASEFGALLTQGTLADACRPTMYDVLANEALRFYSGGEQGVTRPEDAFEVAAEGPALGTVEEFLAWKPEAGEAESGTVPPLLRAIQIHQALLRFHQAEPASAALAEADLGRLTWAENVAVGPEKSARFEKALGGFVERWADLEVSARALHLWAQRLAGRGETAEAHRLASRGLRAHADTPGGKLCYNLVQGIEAPVLQVSTEGVWAAPWAKIKVSYRNLTNVHFRLVAADWESLVTGKVKVPQRMNAAEREAFVASPAVRTWSHELPATPDFAERVEEVSVPEDIEPGYYHLIASPQTRPAGQSGSAVFSSVWVSDLALVLRTGGGRIEGFVLTSESGEPVTDAAVELWKPQPRTGGRPSQALTLGTQTNVDADGRFVLEWKPDEGAWGPPQVRVRAHGQMLAGACDGVGGPEPEPQRQEQAQVFTDRAIYRPGQTIHFKVVCLYSGPERGQGGVITNRELSVSLVDPNQRRVATLKLRANDYGSCAGAFTAPRDGVTGAYLIAVEPGFEGWGAMVRVEEYKRPKFEVTLDAPQEAARLDDVVKLKGRASAYTGAAVDGAKVGYRVVRTVRFPPWCRWWPGMARGGEAQEVGRGVTRTGTDGGFSVEFKARPDRSVPESSEPTFDYAVTVDVTDSAGETRSGERQVRVGYVALEAALEVDDWLSTDGAMPVKVRTTTLDGEPQVAEGVVRLHSLRQPERVQRADLTGLHPRWAPEPAGGRDESSPDSWELGPVLLERGFSAGTNGQAQCSFGTTAGAFRLVLETQDWFGRKVRAQRTIEVVDPEADHLGLRVAHRVLAPRWSVEPGGEFKVLWGTGYDEGRAFVEILHDGKPLRRFWTPPGRTQDWIRQPVTEDLRGGFLVRLTYVRENRAYLEDRRVEVPWTNKKLELSWERFRSKLEPGQAETWSLVIRQGPGTDGAGVKDATAAAAELVATLYDASLDQFQPHQWPERLGQFGGGREEWMQSMFGNRALSLEWLMTPRQPPRKSATVSYRTLLPELVGGPDYGMMRTRGMAEAGRAAVPEMAMAMAPAPAPSPARDPMAKGIAPMVADSLAAGVGGGLGQTPRPGATSPASPRKNLTETAFFLPQLRADTNGVARLSFTMPEALTTWRFLGLAHDRDLRSGFMDAKTVTAKDLMVQPNPPRFLREGDELEFAVKVSNQSDRPATGTVRLNLLEAGSERPVDQALGLTKTEQPFKIPARESRSFFWRLKVPDGLGFLTYKAMASTARLSDGEEGALPVLSRRVFVTESLPLPVRGPATNQFEFKSLAASAQSSTLQHQGLTVQMVSNPAWYAVMALPYLMEFPHECSEQTFNRLYANALARSIATRDPRVRRVFDQWTNTPALDSPLEKNQDLKAVLIEETPWLQQARGESQARRQVGLLFQDERLGTELARAEKKLGEMQLGDGAWPWFPGGPASDYLTLYITTGFGRLRHLGVDVSTAAAVRALAQLDAHMAERFADIQKRSKPEEYVPSATDALYLYGRSFYLKDQALPEGAARAAEFFLNQARQFWVQVGSRQSQGHLALAFKRWGGEANLAAAADIMKSLKERSVAQAELGRFWRDQENGWWWYEAPIETQALMIEAFDEVAGDAAAVEECRVWLLKQKQTQDWKTTKATADAVYALLLRGRDWLGSTNLVRVAVGGVDVTADQVTKGKARGAAVEAGTGMYEQRIEGARVSPKMAQVVVRKQDPGVAWGAVHWQYLEDIGKVKAHTGTPLKLKKELFVKKNTARGPVLEPLNGPLAVGDELVTRVELQVDRDVEYVHLKDQRGSGTEPVNVLSEYKYREGFAYYESTRDTASHFFIDYLRKGTYVFEYSCRVQHRGEYPSGVAEIQCMYAPEFNSHSGSVRLTVR